MSKKNKFNIIIYNPLYNTYPSFIQCMASPFLKKVSLYDDILVRINDSFYDGFITFISEKGVNVIYNDGKSQFFVKWHNVYHIKKINK